MHWDINVTIVINAHAPVKDINLYNVWSEELSTVLKFDKIASKLHFKIYVMQWPLLSNNVYREIIANDQNMYHQLTMLPRHILII